MQSNTIHRDEENGINILMLSGRIVSQIYFNTKIKKSVKKGEKIREATPQCTFVLLVGKKGGFEPFKVICETASVVKKIKSYATEGCRIVLKGYISSKRRTKQDVMKYGLERYVTNIYMDQVINIFDTKKEHDNKLEHMLKQGKTISDIRNGAYPNLKDFDSEY